MFWTLGALFVTEEIFVGIQNDTKIIEDQIGKQIVTISVFRALEALFVAEKSFVVNQNDKDIIEEDSSFHLTYQTLISDH